MFEQRTLVIATMHAKERVIAPLLESHLGVRCITPDDLDTDQLGTFTGEIDRKLDPLATAREKCRLAMAETGCDLAVASEGSFGPHPLVPFAHADDELLVFMDKKYGLDIAAREVSTATNFAAEAVHDASALLAFAERAGFPEHALILRESANSHRSIYKGIVDRDELLTRFSELRDRYGEVYVETDMRAMHNPTRLGVIADATAKLLKLLDSRCPACDMPGLSVTEVIRGLPCELCGLPTQSPSRHLLECQHCHHQKEERFPLGRERENPMYCEFCNP
ncbi:MAG: DUF6671 family protein [Halieaceae bacterium]|jgi:hypothetical protein|nr:DUF6671 family protein [Halieaceae bacterium]